MNTYTIEDWQYEVRNGDTKLGFYDWVAHCTERDEREKILDRLKTETIERR